MRKTPRRSSPLMTAAHGRCEVRRRHRTRRPAWSDTESPSRGVPILVLDPARRSWGGFVKMPCRDWWKVVQLAIREWVRPRGRTDEERG